MTTLIPRKPYTDEELRQLYPAGLELQLVQVLMRHGERTPVSPRFQHAGLHPFWPYCSAVKQFRAAVLEDDVDAGVAGVGVGGGSAATKPLGTLAWKRRLETFSKADDTAVLAKGSRGELDALCDMGMLTDPGRATTLRLGQRLRQLYVDRLHFLPAELKGDDVDRLFYLRATPIPRALESMQQAFTGLYPDRDRSGKPITIVSRAPADETLFPNDGNCRRFAALSRAFAQRAAERWNDSEELAYATKKLGKWMDPDAPRVAVDGRPRLSGVMDTINATLAHGPETRLPAEFYDEKVRRNIDKVALEEWFAGYHESVEYRTLGIGGLMGDLTTRMVTQAETAGTSGQNGLFRFGISGCHDTTLAAVLTSLGHSMPTWPPFTSHLAVEMFKKPASDASPTAAPSLPPPQPASSSSGWSAYLPSFLSSKPAAPTSIGRKPTPDLTETEKHKMAGYYVRIRYNDEVVTVPGCKAAGKHLDGDESFCTLEAFKAIVDKYTPKNWKHECRSNLGKPAFPAKLEPSGY
ncbi:hypothetical protein SBRCBS47491_004170 [Sporothrix bragantina]|uniref:3-phytase n=1 Tax=Sporothrix bragantina TaxID=671064 RepID=A0ABP0BLJ7_9PEZI